MNSQIKKFGSFYIGGRVLAISGMPAKTVYRNPDFPDLLIDPNGEYAVDQAYVQYYIPASAEQRLPVVLAHGGGQTGSVWETTPDGREGWLHYFLGHGRAVYVIDNVERGRAGWCCLPKVWEGEPELRSGKMTWTMFRIGLPDHYEKKIPFPHQQFPINAFEELLRYNVPRWNTNEKSSTDNLAKLCKKIGPCILIVHSQSGAFGVNAVEQAGGSIAGLCLIEPASFGKVDETSRGLPVLTIYGDYLEEFGVWKKIYALALRQKGEFEEKRAHVEWIDLPRKGMIGNSHMMFMDKNHFPIADFVQDWIARIEKR